MITTLDPAAEGVGGMRPWGLRYWGASPQLHSQFGRKCGLHMRVCARRDGFVLYGPYAFLPEGRWIARLQYAGLDGTPAFGRCAMDVCAAGTIVASRQVDLGREGGQVALEFELRAATPAVEVRLYAREAVDVELRSLELSPVQR